MEPLGSRERVEALADRQGGRIGHHQLTHLGFPRGVVRSWVKLRTLIPTLPRVYALGYVRTDRPAQIWDAILYAGPGAALTGACGAYELGLLFYEPEGIKVTTPWQRKSRDIITVLARQPPNRELHDGIPYVSMPELLLELAREGDVPILRRSLESLDYHRKLDLPAVHRICGKGRRGSVLLRHALTHRLPQLAFCKSLLEIDFVLLLEAHGLRLPKVNCSLHGEEPDMYWPELKLVVELDGGANHGTPAQKRRDARKDALLRSHGLTVIRLTYDDVHERPALTLARLADLGVGRGSIAA